MTVDITSSYHIKLQVLRSLRRLMNVFINWLYTCKNNDLLTQLKTSNLSNQLKLARIKLLWPVSKSSSSLRENWKTDKKIHSYSRLKMVLKTVESYSAVIMCLLLAHTGNSSIIRPRRSPDPDEGMFSKQESSCDILWYTHCTYLDHWLTDSAKIWYKIKQQPLFIICRKHLWTAI